MDNKKIYEIQDEVQSMFSLLQQIQAPMTESNIVLLKACLGSLKYIGKLMEEEKKGAEEDAGKAEAK